MKPTPLLLALLLTAKLGAADAPKVFAPPQSLSVPSSFTVSGTLSFSVGLSSHQDPDGQFRVFHSTREPVVTKTADGWVITFREPETPESIVAKWEMLKKKNPYITADSAENENGFMVLEFYNRPMTYSGVQPPPERWKEKMGVIDGKIAVVAVMVAAIKVGRNNWDDEVTWPKEWTPVQSAPAPATTASKSTP